MDSNKLRDGSADRLGSAARTVFELSPATMMVVASRDGRVVELNSAGRRLLGPAFQAEALKVILDGDAGRLVLQIEDDEHRFPVRCMPIPEAQDQFLATLVEETGPEVLSDTFGSVLPSIGAVTDRILHDVRNLILPLVCHMDVAMASVDVTSEAYSSLLEVQASCRRCEGELEKLSALSASRGLPERYVHVEDVLDRAALLLRYVLPRQVKIDTAAEEVERLIRVSPTEFQRLLVDVTSLAHGRRDAIRAVRLCAEEEDEDLLLRLEIRAPREASAPDYVGEQVGITKVLASRVDVPHVETSVKVTPEGLEFLLRVKKPLTVSSRQLENREIAGGRGERVLVLHHLPMMRDLLKNYLAGKGYVCSAHATLDEVLDLLQQGSDALVADLSTDEIDKIRHAVREGRVARLAAMVVCRGEIKRELPLPARRLDHPFRMDEVAGALRSLLDLTEARDLDR
ncbi:MAG: PAS domain-containing protein [Planctomycetes bacterium]|nr:PAS domain-containing protein [Planctomycetota bacterium]